jgi:hypothetical protein
MVGLHLKNQVIPTTGDQTSQQIGSGSGVTFDHVEFFFQEVKIRGVVGDDVSITETVFEVFVGGSEVFFVVECICVHHFFPDDFVQILLPLLLNVFLV